VWGASPEASREDATAHGRRAPAGMTRHSSFESRLSIPSPLRAATCRANGCAICEIDWNGELDRRSRERGSWLRMGPAIQHLAVRQSPRATYLR
jgi:hypothetical protein